MPVVKHLDGYTSIRVTLPAFAIMLLQRRAKERRLSVSALVEGLVLDQIMVDEIRAMARHSAEFARLVSEWLRGAVRRAR